MPPPATAVPTACPRAGRRFEPLQERALHEAALRACASLRGAAADPLVVSEMTGPFGVPDLVALIGHRELLDQRLGLAVPPLLNELDAGIVAATRPTSGRSVAVIAKALAWPEDTVRRRIPDLLRVGALLERRTGSYTREDALQPLGRIYAVEAKLKQWRRAVHQGRLYGLWADNYVLVMAGLATRSMAAALADVQRDGAGLMVDGRWIRRPAARRLPGARRLWAAEHLVAALLPHHQPSVRP